MIPPIDAVRRIIVISEDVLGPMQNSLLIELVDGGSISLDDKTEIKRFITEIERVRPYVAADVRQAVETVRDHPSEQVFEL